MPLTSSTIAAIDRRTKDDPDFAAAVDAELQAMRIEQELVAPRVALAPHGGHSSPYGRETPMP